MSTSTTTRRVPSPYAAGLRVWRDTPRGRERGTVVEVTDDWQRLGIQLYQAIVVRVDGQDVPVTSAWLGWYRLGGRR